MKAYTNIKQSKKLAEMLPIDSADNVIVSFGSREGTTTLVMPKETLDAIRTPFSDIREVIPCWSLAALLNLLPNEISTGERYCDKYQIDIRKYDGVNNTTFYQIGYGNDRGRSGNWHDMINTGERENLIDACYEMIILLKEQNIL